MKAPFRVKIGAKICAKIWVKIWVKVCTLTVLTFLSRVLSYLCQVYQAYNINKTGSPPPLSLHQARTQLLPLSNAFHRNTHTSNTRRYYCGSISSYLYQSYLVPGKY